MRRSGGRAATRPYVEAGILAPSDLSHPVFEFDRRLRLLEGAFYRHVLRVIDLDALFGLEQKLWSKLQDMEQLSDDQVLDISNAIVERALERIGRDPARAMKEGILGPNGRVVDAPDEPHDRCPFCATDGDHDADADRDDDRGDDDDDDRDDDDRDRDRDDDDNEPEAGGGAPAEDDAGPPERREPRHAAEAHP